MNERHLEICSSQEWAEFLEAELAPWVLSSTELGDRLLEIGPGPGLTTDLLRQRVARLTAVELDGDLARQLNERLGGSNIDTVCADGVYMPFASGQFSCAVLLTMLHHLPEPGLQDRMLSEAFRVLEPGGSILGSDGMDTPGRRELHEDDIFVPVDPATWGDRLRRAGFSDANVEIRGDRFKFSATKAA